MLQEEEKGYCSGKYDLEDAKKVCEHIRIPFLQVNFVKEYWNNVFSEFLAGLQV
jgi:tRNA-specific 2-thiouridylase